MLIAVVNQKGGAGKTTLAVHLAVHLFDQGLRVAFVDNDPQASATKWLSSVEPGIPMHSTQDSRELVELLQTLNDSHDVVIADAAPRLNDQTHVLMYFAQRVLIPVKPSVLDLQATVETKSAVDRVASARTADHAEPIAVRLILNMVRSVGQQDKIMSQAMESLNLPLAKQTVGLRDAYIKAVHRDTTVTRMKGDAGAVAAARELVQLFTEVIPHELYRNQPVAA